MWDTLNWTMGGGCCGRRQVREGNATALRLPAGADTRVHGFGRPIDSLMLLSGFASDHFDRVKNDVSISHFTSSERQSILHNKPILDGTKLIHMRSVPKARKHTSPKVMVTHIEKTKNTIEASAKLPSTRDQASTEKQVVGGST